MRITMVAVASVDGRITDGTDDVRRWASREDAALFSSLIRKSTLVIMGRKTYETVRERIVLSPEKLRVVLTRRPAQFRNKEGLEFTGKQPAALVKDLEARGYREALLAGGGAINALFLKAGLVDEVRLTMEPGLFGQGRPLVDGPARISLTLISSRKLNARGTLHLRYKVKK